jgi:hypothetical protein
MNKFNYIIFFLLAVIGVVTYLYFSKSTPCPTSPKCEVCQKCEVCPKCEVCEKCQECPKCTSIVGPVLGSLVGGFILCIIILFMIGFYHAKKEKKGR